MNKIFFSLSSVFFLSCVVGLFFVGGEYIIYQIEFQLKEDLRERTSQYIKSITPVIREQLLIGNTRKARNILAKLKGDTVIEDYRIRRSGQVIDQSSPLLNTDGILNLFIKVPIFFTASGSLWGDIEYAVSTSNIVATVDRVKKTIRIGVVAIALMMVIFLIFVFCCQYWAIGQLVRSFNIFLPPTHKKRLSWSLKVVWGPLVKIIMELQTRIVSYQKEVVQLQKKKTVADTASQVAHDIRSPLTALEMATEDIDTLDEDTRIMIRGGVARIRDIANNLLQTKKQIDIDDHKSSKSRNVETSLLSSLIEPIISEKRTQHRDKIGLDINFKMSAVTYGIFSAVNQVEFKRLLSNLINNAAEALPEGEGKIEVKLNGTSTDAVIKIIDNGSGMPESILNQLGQEGKTFGKKKGNGLGVFHAKTTVEGWDGIFHIKSKEGLGTEVVITLKRTEAPKWFVEKIKLDADVVILDDDCTIHKVWDNRFKITGVDNYKVYHFLSANEAKDWFHLNKKHPFIFLCDFELIGQNTDGVKFIESLGISDRSILVTSRYDEKKVRGKCKELGIKLIPKPLAACVPIEVLQSEGPLDKNSDASISTNEERKVPSSWGVSIFEAVYIDDDKYLRMGWNRGAKKRGVKLHLFDSPSDFKSKNPKLDQSIPFFIDSSYGEREMRGEDFARELHDQGYQNLYLATGHDAHKFEKYTFLKGVIGKDPPWEEKFLLN